ncbi:MAG: winged helix DNA-binding protein [Streptococcaceae bacterium]|jgi:DNA-binding MarR family transcriptional regulator|nr:winged helix DNA-binding protein [Streptococcaceae bacterium]
MDIEKLTLELHYMQQAYATLFSVVNKIQTRGDEVMEEITSRQQMALIAIVHLPQEETTLINIATMLATTKQTANKLITGLKNKGYIETIPSKKDKRSINVIITETGKNVLIKSSEKTTYFLADIFNEFTSEEVELFWHMLQKLYCFDGEEQNGFEERASFGIDKESDNNEVQLKNKIMEEFSKRRKKHVLEGNNK